MKKIHLLLIIMIAGLAACKTSMFTYQSEKTKGVDYSKYKTYAFLPTKDTAFTKLANKANIEKALAREVMTQLTAHGMKLDTLNPDCLFTYTLVIKRTQQIGQKAPEVSSVYAFAPTYPGNEGNVYYYRPDYGPTNYVGSVSVSTYRDGSLVVEMIDRKDSKVIWSSSAAARQNEEELQGARTTIKEIIPEMFKKFPVKL
ncbi:MAG: DUF4136 domain-containing protein [Chitinophagales bacterium]